MSTPLSKDLVHSFVRPKKGRRKKGETEKGQSGERYGGNVPTKKDKGTKK